MKFKFILLLLIFNFSCSPVELLLDEPPMVLLVAGQSNAVGTGEASQSPNNLLNCFEYDSKFNLIVTLKDPVGQNHLNFQAASTGSFTPSLAFNLSNKTNQKVFIVQCAKGGSALHPLAETNSYGNWDYTGELLPSSFIKIQKMLFKINQKFYKKPNLDGIVWSQGENDGQAIGIGLLSRTQYKNALKNLILNYRNRYGAALPFFIIETGRHTSCAECDLGNEIVRQVQREVANEDVYTFIGYNETEYFDERNWLSDSVHYNQEALNDIGEKLANFIIVNNIID